jgi:hypothetical protein
MSVSVLSLHKLTTCQGATGKTVLQGQISDENCTEYHNLGEDEKMKLLQEYSEHKETKTTGICISTKSKINETQTLKAVKNEASHLGSVWPRNFDLN